MDIPDDLRDRISAWDCLSRWERSELGKDLRRLGLSYREIMTHIPVKKSTLATWCRDIQLQPEQYEAIKRRTGSREGIPTNSQWRRREEIAAIRRAAGREARTRLGDPLWLAGTVLYWAEGSKTNNILSLTNTDPAALRVFIGWVRSYLRADAEFSLGMHLHEGNDEDAAKAYWRRETGLSTARFTRTFIKPAGTGHRKNHLPHGVCRVRMDRASDSWNRVLAWIDMVAELLPVSVGHEPV